MHPRIPNDGWEVSTKRVVLVLDHALLRAVLAMRLDQEPDFEVSARCASQAEAHDADFRKCDVVIINIYLPDATSGRQLMRELRDALPHEIPVIALTTSRDPQVHAEALRAGASEVLTMAFGFDNIIEALRRILGGA